MSLRYPSKMVRVQFAHAAAAAAAAAAVASVASPPLNFSPLKRQKLLEFADFYRSAVLGLIYEKPLFHANSETMKSYSELLKNVFSICDCSNLNKERKKEPKIVYEFPLLQVPPNTYSSKQFKSKIDESLSGVVANDFIRRNIRRRIIDHVCGRGIVLKCTTNDTSTSYDTDTKCLQTNFKFQRSLEKHSSWFSVSDAHELLNKRVENIDLFHQKLLSRRLLEFFVQNQVLFRGVCDSKNTPSVWYLRPCNDNLDGNAMMNRFVEDFHMVFTDVFTDVASSSPCFFPESLKFKTESSPKFKTERLFKFCWNLIGIFRQMKGPQQLLSATAPSAAAVLESESKTAHPGFAFKSQFYKTLVDMCIEHVHVRFDLDTLDIQVLNADLSTSLSHGNTDVQEGQPIFSTFLTSFTCGPIDESLDESERLFSAIANEVKPHRISTGILLFSESRFKEGITVKQFQDRLCGKESRKGTIFFAFDMKGIVESSYLCVKVLRRFLENELETMRNPGNDKQAEGKGNEHFDDCTEVLQQLGKMIDAKESFHMKYPNSWKAIISSLDYGFYRDQLGKARTETLWDSSWASSLLWISVDSKHIRLTPTTRFKPRRNKERCSSLKIDCVARRTFYFWSFVRVLKDALKDLKEYKSRRDLDELCVDLSSKLFHECRVLFFRRSRKIGSTQLNNTVRVLDIKAKQYIDCVSRCGDLKSRNKFRHEFALHVKKNLFENSTDPEIREAIESHAKVANFILKKLLQENDLRLLPDHDPVASQVLCNGIEGTLSILRHFGREHSRRVAQHDLLIPLPPVPREDWPKVSYTTDLSQERLFVIDEDIHSQIIYANGPLFEQFKASLQQYSSVEEMRALSIADDEHSFQQFLQVRQYHWFESHRLFAEFVVKIRAIVEQSFLRATEPTLLRPFDEETKIADKEQWEWKFDLSFRDLQKFNKKFSSPKDETKRLGKLYETHRRLFDALKTISCCEMPVGGSLMTDHENVGRIWMHVICACCNRVKHEYMCDLLKHEGTWVLDTMNLTDKRVEPVRVDPLPFIQNALTKATEFSKVCFQAHRSHFQFPRQGHTGFPSPYTFPSSEYQDIKISLQPQYYKELEFNRYKHSDRLGEDKIQENVDSSGDDGKYFFKVTLRSDSDDSKFFQNNAHLKLQQDISDGLPPYSDVTYDTQVCRDTSKAIFLIKCNLLGLLMDIHRAIQAPPRDVAIDLRNIGPGAHKAVHVPSHLLLTVSELLVP